MGKIKNQTALWSSITIAHVIRKVTSLLRYSDVIMFYVTSQYFQELLWAFFRYKNVVFKDVQVKNPYLCEDMIDKILPSRSPFVITPQALWCQTVILRTDISPHPHTCDGFFYGQTSVTTVKCSHSL